METPKTFSDPVTPEERDRYLSHFLKVDAALKADLYHWTSKDDHQDKDDSTLSEDQKERVGTFAFGKKYALEHAPEKLSSTGAFLGWTAEETVQQYTQMIRKNREGDRGTYIMPKSESVHYILIDDIKSDAQKTAAKTFTPAVCVESSRGNFQVILKVHAFTADAEIAKAAANKTIVEINRTPVAEGQTLGDPKIVKCLQAWRAPGFENHKPKHKDAEGNFPEVKLHLAQDVFCTKAQEIYDRHVQELLQEQQQAPARPVTAKTKTEGKTYTAPVAEVKAPAHAEQLYRLHAVDILKRRPGIEGHEIDHHVAQRLLATGHTPEETTAILIKGAPAFRPDRSHEWGSYIPPTVKYAAQSSAAFANSYSGLVRLWRNLEMQIIENGKTADEVLKKQADRKKSLSR